MKKIVLSILALALLASCKSKSASQDSETKKPLSIKKDKDQDGVPNKADHCPDVAGPVENEGCPWPDTDGDGIIDKDDACPSVAGPAENNGCPWPDSDGDGVLDKDDACPSVPGLAEYKGCPKPYASVAMEVSYESRAVSDKAPAALKAKVAGISVSTSKSETKSVSKTEEELPKAGQLTAGEVNDFSKWNYWKDIAAPVLSEYKETWKFFPDKRVSIQLVNEMKKPIIGKKIILKNQKGVVLWEAISDNRGNAELWINPRVDVKETEEKYVISDENDKILSEKVKLFVDGQNIISLNEQCIQKRNLDLAFVVDATGSMGDEIKYLQSELLDVLKNVESKIDQSNKVRYGSVFYRDHGDQYVTKELDFSDNAETLISFIKKQEANGGGDTPEAVVEALDSALDKLSWSNDNSTKIIFLILDAPPHISNENIDHLFSKIKEAAKKGITIIPLAASDTDKQTEYLMRTFALLTNGTYTFLTNHSGIGNNHIEPTTDSYEVEKLNDLLLRLILQRATIPSCNEDSYNSYVNKKLESELDDKLNYKIKIYPNPTDGLLTIQSTNPLEELYVYDYSGKILIRKEKLPKGNNKIDITSYPQSIYLIRCKHGKEWDTFKIIKK